MGGDVGVAVAKAFGWAVTAALGMMIGMSVGTPVGGDVGVAVAKAFGWAVT